MSTPQTTSAYALVGYGKSNDIRGRKRSGWVKTRGYNSTPKGADSIPGFSGTLLLEREEEEMTEGHWTVTRYFSTVDSIPATYELDVSCCNSPIGTHPKFAEFATEANGAQFDPTTGEFRGFFKVPLVGAMTNRGWVGVVDFLAPGVVWREIIQTGGYDLNLAGVGTVQSPSGPCPGAPSGYSWLYVGGSMSGTSGRVTQRREWRLSGPGGWNPQIYS